MEIREMGKPVIAVGFEGQNGKSLAQNLRVKTACPATKRHKKKHKKRHRAHRR